MKLGELKSIRNEGEYEKALALLRILRGAESGSKEYAYRSKLKRLVMDYESTHHPFGEEGFEEWAQQMQEGQAAEHKAAEIEKAEMDAARFIDNWRRFIEARKTIVKRKIKEKHTTQGRLAEMLHLRKAHLSNILNGRRTLNANVVVLMSHYLEIPYEKLLPPVEVAQGAIMAD
ncbi:helix-turn-helix domain-containing protein [Pontibacter cellulosilyticus]|uniref:Helix-turn-helix transcriptional regulator n=1 Tax=Pontibacter cellulosilyticus TaxID=1720253 RepID=A0A923N8A1_9BACT|nr:helix-turn-helix transcriptional regulator [Pontibacter cellulosilyticus]MBC5994024.1 helix-turn-helix transcriptional regulator [Pontibacter cellulosilyticus]